MTKAPWEVEEGLSKRDLLKLGIYGGLTALIGGLGIPSDYVPEERLFNGKYGKVIKRFRPNAPNQIFIVGQKHGLNVLDEHLAKIFNNVLEQTYKEAKIAKTQVEIFRILESLFKNSGLDFVFVEGAFATEDNLAEYRKSYTYTKQKYGGGYIEQLKRFDDDRLEKLIEDILSDVNSDYLIGLIYDVAIQGAESKEMHEFHMELVNLKFKASLAKEKDVEKISGAAKDYARKFRSGLILLNAPAVINKEKKKEKNRAAIVIGDNHLDEMIEFIERDRMEIKAPEGLPLKDIDIKLGLRDYGFTIIRPKSLIKK